MTKDGTQKSFAGAGFCIHPYMPLSFSLRCCPLISILVVLSWYKGGGDVANPHSWHLPRETIDRCFLMNLFRWITAKSSVTSVGRSFSVYRRIGWLKKKKKEVKVTDLSSTLYALHSLRQGLSSSNENMNICHLGPDLLCAAKSVPGRDFLEEWRPHSFGTKICIRGGIGVTRIS